MNTTESVNILNNLNNLKPACLWQFFSQIAAIPHTSYHEQALINWILSWAKTKDLKIQQDEVGNLIISKAASKGMENCKGVILQAHLDMVGQKSDCSAHDFLNDPIELLIAGQWLTANGTTLGADNGIGMAASLAVLDSDDLVHGPLEVLLTINEEAGMDGAKGLESGLLQGDLLVNTDSEQEGEVFMGCAGGGDTQIRFNGHVQNVEQDYISANIKVSGLKGGHSGCDIDSGRANANILLAQLIVIINETTEFNIVDIAGGSLRNAIPREAKVQIVCTPENFNHIQEQIGLFELSCQSKLGDIETDLSIKLSQNESVATRCFEPDFAQGFITAFGDAPNGVINMNEEIAGVVETSLNLGIVKTSIIEGKAGNNEVCVELGFLCRSLKDSERLALELHLHSLFTEAGAEVCSDNDYPGWQPQPDSELIQLVKENFEDLFNQSPKLMVIHAGLECGLIQKVYPNVEMVSIGPTIKYPHSPDEKVDIASVGIFWQWLTKILANVPKHQ